MASPQHVRNQQQWLHHHKGKRKNVRTAKKVQLQCAQSTSVFSSACTCTHVMRPVMTTTMAMCVVTFIIFILLSMVRKTQCPMTFLPRQYHKLQTPMERMLQKWVSQCLMEWTPYIVIYTCEYIHVYNIQNSKSIPCCYRKGVAGELSSQWIPSCPHLLRRWWLCIFSMYFVYWRYIINNNEGNYACFNERLNHQIFAYVSDTRMSRGHWLASSCCERRMLTCACAAPFGALSTGRKTSM